MWTVKKPGRVKLIIGILAADNDCLQAACGDIITGFGPMDLKSEVWPFEATDYYKDETGENILRQFVSIEKLIDPGRLAKIKHKSNKIEQKLADKLAAGPARPVNLDPGYIEPSKLVLATTKNYSHRIYIGKKIYAEATLIFEKGKWQPMPYTYPDYKQQCYHNFFDKVRARLLEQVKEVKN